MTTEQWLKTAQAALQEAGVDTARLDTLVLLEDCLELDRARLLAHPEMTLDDTQLALLQTRVDRRARHEPLAYIRGHAEFYGRDFVVNEHVLVPRPETEAMIELLKDLMKTDGSDGIIADIGTGSGALAVTAACELRHTKHKFYGTDIDSECLAVARRNAAHHGADITFVEGDLTRALPTNEPVFALLCNLPYVPDEYDINTAAGHEPKLALFGGEDGLDLYRRLFAQIHDTERKPGYVLTETLPEQHDRLVSTARHYNFRLLDRSDFILSFVADDTTG